MTNASSTSPFPCRIIPVGQLWYATPLLKSSRTIYVYRPLPALQVSYDLYMTTMYKVSIGTCTHVSGPSCSVLYVSTRYAFRHVLSRWLYYLSRL